MYHRMLLNVTIALIQRLTGASLSGRGITVPQKPSALTMVAFQKCSRLLLTTSTLTVLSASLLAELTKIQARMGCGLCFFSWRSGSLCAFLYSL